MLPCRTGAATTGNGRAFGSEPPRPGAEGASELLWKKMNQAPTARIAVITNAAAIHSARVRAGDLIRVSGGASLGRGVVSFMAVCARGLISAAIEASLRSYSRAKVRGHL